MEFSSRPLHPHLMQSQMRSRIFVISNSGALKGENQFIDFLLGRLLDPLLQLVTVSLLTFQASTMEEQKENELDYE